VWLVSGEYNVSITASMCPITRYAATLTAYQRPKSSNHVVSSCLAILQELTTWNWTIIEHYVLQYEAHHPRGGGHQDDQDRHGHEQSRLICALWTSDCIPLGAGHRTALPGRNSWGQLRPAKGHPTDDVDR